MGSVNFQPQHERLRYFRATRGVLEIGTQRFRDDESDTSVDFVPEAQRVCVDAIKSEAPPEIGLRGRSVSLQNHFQRENEGFPNYYYPCVFVIYYKKR